jgi:peptidyl-prolyl cis-trans isomerase C
MSRRLATAASLLIAAGCGAADAPPTAVKAALPPGVLARVGDELVGSATVGRLFEARGLTAEAAAGIAVSDALWAQGARTLLSAGRTRAVERTALARSLLEELSRAAQAEGPPTDAEVTGIVSERWLELARPAAVRTTHVVVLNDKPERDAAAREVAGKLAAALKDAKTSADLLRIGKEFPGEGFEIRPEALAFVTTDGRTFHKENGAYEPLAGKFDPDFTRAANALTTPGQLSPVTKSHFGYHIILLEEREPAQIIAPAELGALLGPEVVARRAAKARRQLVERLRQQRAVQVERALEELTAKAQPSP